MAKAKLIGLDKVIKNLNKEIQRIEGASMAGLWDAGLQIQRASQKRVPVDTGNLKGSHYTRIGMNPGPISNRLARLDSKGSAPDPDGTVPPNTVEMGATADYAMAVHENMEAKRRVGGPKFLERAITDNVGKILEIIRRRAKIA